MRKVVRQTYSHNLQRSTTFDWLVSDIFGKIHSVSEKSFIVIVIVLKTPENSLEKYKVLPKSYLKSTLTLPNPKPKLTQGCLIYNTSNHHLPSGEVRKLSEFCLTPPHGFPPRKLKKFNTNYDCPLIVSTVQPSDLS